MCKYLSVFIAAVIITSNYVNYIHFTSTQDQMYLLPVTHVSFLTLRVAFNGNILAKRRKVSEERTYGVALQLQRTTNKRFRAIVVTLVGNGIQTVTWKGSSEVLFVNNP